MKFFKHFTDAHTGESLQALKREFGMAGIGRYWTLIEICANRIEKRSDEEANETHCQFRFDIAYLTATLGYGNATQTLTYLRRVADLSLTSFERQGDVVVTSIPKLLECMDSDYRRSRHDRGTVAPKIKKEIKKENKKERESDSDVLEFPPDQQPALTAPRAKFSIRSADDLMQQIPVIQLDLWRQKFGEVFESEVRKAYEFHTIDPDHTPNTKRKWLQHLVTWLAIVEKQPGFKNAAVKQLAEKRFIEELEAIAKEART